MEIKTSGTREGFQLECVSRDAYAYYTPAYCHPSNSSTFRATAMASAFRVAASAPSWRIAAAHGSTFSLAKHKYTQHSTFTVKIPGFFRKNWLLTFAPYRSHYCVSPALLSKVVAIHSVSLITSAPLRQIYPVLRVSSSSPQHFEYRTSLFRLFVFF